MIGHLQRNKVKYIAPFINLIHGVDNIKLLKEINKQARKNDRIIDCLIQVKISSEDSKFGIDYKQANEWLTTDLLIDFKNIRITGFMGMASNTNNELKLIEEFSTLNSFFNKHQNTNIKILSMGMSNDYLLAIKNGSNMIRVGSKIFGARK
jgi:pyridoxal phosphate enzyme (YggS family)